METNDPPKLTMSAQTITTTTTTTAAPEAAQPPQSLDFLVQIPDKPNSLPHRLSNLPAHLAYNKPHVEAGKLVLTGPTLASHPPAQPQGPLPMTGTVTIFKAGSEEEVWEMVRGNPFATEGVWDMERASVTPFRCAVRVAM